MWKVKRDVFTKLLIPQLLSGGWLGYGLVEEIWKGSLRRLSERSR